MLRIEILDSVVPFRFWHECFWSEAIHLRNVQIDSIKGLIPIGTNKTSVKSLSPLLPRQIFPTIKYITHTRNTHSALYLVLLPIPHSA